MIQSKFVIDKESLRNNFYLKDLKPQRNWFLKITKILKGLLFKKSITTFLKR